MTRLLTPGSGFRSVQACAGCIGAALFTAFINEDIKMSLLSLVFFALFVVTVFVSYIALRRRLARPAVIGAACATGCVVFMMLFSLASGNLFAHALVVGIAMGGAFAAATLAIALYFQGSELREQMREKR